MNFDTMADVARAFKELSRLVNAKGRLKHSLERLARARFISVLTGSPMLEAKMAPRAERRAKARLSKRPPRKNARRAAPRKAFRPVPGYRGIPAADHKECIRLMILKATETEEKADGEV